MMLIDTACRCMLFRCGVLLKETLVFRRKSGIILLPGAWEQLPQPIRHSPGSQQGHQAPQGATGCHRVRGLRHGVKNTKLIDLLQFVVLSHAKKKKRDCGNSIYSVELQNKELQNCTN